MGPFTQILFIRHGLVDDKIVAGKKADLPLTSDGRKQMYHLGQDLGKKRILLATLVSSPRIRAIQSAEEIRKGYANQGYRVDIELADLLDDVDSPAVDGESSDRLAWIPRGTLSHGSERPENVIARIEPVVHGVIRNYPDQVAAMVLHLDTINTYLAYKVRGLIEPDNLEFSIGRGQIWRAVFDSNGACVLGEGPKRRGSETEY